MEHRRIVASCLLAMFSLVLATGTIAGVSDESSSASAEEALAAFFGALSSGDYESAVDLYGGTYEILAGWNPEVNPDNKAALLKSGCMRNGLQCLELRRIVERRSMPDGAIRFVVEFSTHEGELFVRGPCGDEDSAASSPELLFTYDVGDVGGRFKVFGLPPYVP